MASVEQLPSGKWRGVAYHPSGDPKLRRRSPAHPLKGPALQWAKDVEAAWRTNRHHDPTAGEMTVGQWVVEWGKSRVVETATAKKNASHLRNHILPRWEHDPLASVNRLEVATWIKAMAKAGTRPPTIQAAVRLLATILGDAADVGRIPSNPAARQTTPPLEVAPPKWFTEAEAALVLAEVHPRWVVACELAFNIGLRPGELLGLKVGATDWAARTIYVHGVMTPHGWRSYPKTAGSVDTVPIPDHLMDPLAPYLLGRGPEEFVFPGPEGHGVTPGNFRNRVWDPAVALAGACARHRDEGKRVAGCRGCKLTDPLPGRPKRPCPPHRRPTGARSDCLECTPVPAYTPNVMRHTAASWLVQGGMDLYRVQALLRHQRQTTTERYAHLAPSTHQEIREAIGRRQAGQQPELTPEIRATLALLGDLLGSQVETHGQTPNPPHPHGTKKPPAPNSGQGV